MSWLTRNRGPLLMSEELEALGQKILGMTTADTVSIDVVNTIQGTARVAQNRIRANDDGNMLRIDITTQFGQRGAVTLAWDRIDDHSLRVAVAYAEQVAREQSGDPIRLPIPERPRHYLPATVWHQSTMDAMGTAQNTILPDLISAFQTANMRGSLFVGVMARSRLSVTKSGLQIAGQETDAELVASGWTADGTAMGWAGQANRDWTQLQPQAVVSEAIRLTALDHQPVAVEPGRWTVILGRPAMAQFAAMMAYAWGAWATIVGHDTPFWDEKTQDTKLQNRVLDNRITIRVDPDDPEGGYLPFDHVEPLVPMTFVDQGRLAHLAFSPAFAAQVGVTPPNGNPVALRMEGTGPLEDVEQMIAASERAIFINRVADLRLRVEDLQTGLMSGVTQGGCYLVERGQITKPVRNFLFFDSPFFFLNNLIAIGPSERTAFGYSPWAGDWPIPPSIVPPVMVRDFNLVRLADAV